MTAIGSETERAAGTTSGGADLMPLRERLFAQLKSKQPDCSVDTFIEPVSAYGSPEHFVNERKALFLRYPVFGGWSAQVKKPNGFRTLEIAGVPLLLTRDKEGVLHGFRNVCRHRGMILAEEAEGCASRFTCPFHGWTFDTKGKLIGVPFREGFPGVDADSHSLIPIAVAEKYGLIFVRIEGDGPIDIDQHLGGLGPELGSLGWESWTAGPSNFHDVPVNWKLLVDGFGESYHFPVVHSKTLGAVVIPNTHVVDTFGPHVRELFANVGLRELALQEPGARPEPLMGRDLAIVYLISPNLVVFGVSEFGWQAVSMWPGNTESEATMVETMLVNPNAPPEVRAQVEHRCRFNWESIILAEDVPLAVKTMKAIKSGSVPNFVFGRNEIPIQHLHRHYREMAGNPNAA